MLIEGVRHIRRIKETFTGNNNREDGGGVRISQHWPRQDWSQEEVWSQIKNCRNEEGKILADLVREDGIAQFTPEQRDNHGKGSF